MDEWITHYHALAAWIKFWVYGGRAETEITMKKR
jgi:hypothetical protein